MVTALLGNLCVKLPLWKYDLEPSSFRFIHNYLPFGEPFGFLCCLFCFSLVWRLFLSGLKNLFCSMSVRSAGPWHNSEHKVTKTDGELWFSERKGFHSNMGVKWNLHLVTFTVLPAVTIQTYIHIRVIWRETFKHLVFVCSLKLFSLLEWEYF